MRYFSELNWENHIESIDELDMPWDIKKYNFHCIDDNKCVILGGQHNNDYVPTDAIYIKSGKDDYSAEFYRTLECRSNCFSAVLGDKIYIFGGKDKNGELTKTCESFDLSTKKSEYLPEMSQCICNASCVTFKRENSDWYVIVAGGYNGEDTVTNEVNGFNVTKNRWETMFTTSVGFAEAAVGVIRNKLIITGGIVYNERKGRLSSAYGGVIHDLETGDTANGASLPYRLKDFSYANVGGRIVVSAMTLKNSRHYMFLYNVNEDKWIVIERLHNMGGAKKISSFGNTLVTTTHYEIIKSSKVILKNDVRSLLRFALVNNTLQETGHTTRKRKHIT